MAPGGPGDWQFEADLLAEGRQALERFSRSRRFRYLYPEGPSLALLLMAYQELDRQRAVGRIRGGLRRQARALRRIVVRVAREDAIGRTRRLQYRYPTPRAHQILAPPDLVRRALGKVDADARRLVETRLFGQRAVPDPSVSMASEAAREARGLAQFRDALVNEALASPAALVRLHPQYLLFAATPPPARRHHPIATFLLVKLPLQLVGALLTLLVVGYIGAWAVFNDEVLGDFVSDRVSGLVEGELRMGSIHWDLPLVYDLVTGRPSHVVVEDVTVWEPYESYGGERLRRAAHADRLEVKIVLHEIIPWNRLGIPRALDIPWVLHFTDVQTDDAAWFQVRQYTATDDEGVEHRLIGLRDAFVPVKPPDPDRRGLSFAVDRASLARVELDLDFEETAEWRTQLVLDWANFGLRFDAPPAGSEGPLELPLVVWLEALGRHGAVRIKGLEVPLSDIEITRFASGLGGTPRADVALSAKVNAAGSPMTMHGVLGRALAREEPTDPFGDLTTVQLSAATPDGGPLVRQVLREMQLPPNAFVADGAPVTATIEGPLRDPRYEIAVQGASIDPLDEPAWTATNVALSAVIEPGEVPERFADPSDPTAERKVVTFDTLRGDALHGAFQLYRGTPATIVMPQDEGEPWRLSVDLALDGIDPAQLQPEDPEAAAVLGGQASGHLDVRRLVLASPTEADPDASTLRLAELVFEDTTLVRDRGPADDGLPQRIEAEGRVLIDETGAIDLSDLRLSTDGGYVEIDGGVDGELERVRETLLRLRIDRGPAFSRALGIDDYFDTLRADITVYGPLFSPSSKPGSLHVTGVGDPGAPPTDATIRLDGGTLHVRTDNAHLFGSTGRVDAQVVLFAGGELLSDPRVKADVALAGVKIEELLGPDAGVSGIVDVALTIDDGHGRPTPIDRLTIAGKARAAKLRFGGTLYRDAEIEFTLLPESLRIDRLVLPIHRPVSPLSAPDVTVPIGEVVASGSVGLERDPSLDLAVTARGVPVGVVARLLDLDAPVRGQIAEGTDLRVGGTVARPKVEGTVRLEGLSSSGLLLGSGQLEVTSADFSADGPLASHREVRARGELATPDREKAKLQWTVDAVVAIGETRGRDRPPIDAEVDVSFDRLSISTLLTAADPTAPAPAVSGRLEGVGGHVLACNDGAPMLSACMDASARPALAVDLQVERAWISGEALPESTTDPCAHVTTLCSENRLDARLDWPLVELARPWTLRMGDAGAASLQVTGGLDLSSETQAEAATASAAPSASMDVQCRPPGISGSPPPAGRPRRTSGAGDSGPRAEVRGVVDLRALGPLLGDAGVEIERGRLDVDLSIAGRLGDPRVSGRVTLADAPRAATGAQPAGSASAEPIVLTVPGVALPLEIRDLDLRVVGDWLAAAGTLAVGGEELDFGSVRGKNTGLALSGPCMGRFAGAAEGAVSSALLNALAGRTIASKGSVDVARLDVAGSTTDGLQRAQTSLRFGSRALELELTEGLEDLEITGGTVDLALCTAESCPAMPEGTIAVHLAGEDGADDRERPAQALAARVGPRGRAYAWGSAYLAPDLSHFEASDVVVQMYDVPYRDYDSRGRSVFELEASSDAVRLQGGDPLVVSGTIDLGDARYVKDAIEGVNLLAFTDSVDVPEAPPPEIMRTVQLDLRVQTESLARIENNIAHRVEARLAVDLTGTYEHPELAGRIDIEPGGTVDIPFVTGTYEIQRGRVDLVGEIGDAEVDVLALRLEPIYVEGSARRISLLLGGTVSAITWDCIVAGDTTGAAETQRGCLDYLVLGAGDVALDTDVQRLGGGGLTNARKPLQVVGHVTEFDFGKRIEDAAPRYRSYVPNVKARLGQIGPELVIASPEEWLDFDYGHATFGWHYTRGYPGFLLRQSRELTLRLEILDPVSVEYSRDNRDYLNERIVFDPLQQRTIELRFDFEIPSLR